MNVAETAPSNNNENTPLFKALPVPPLMDPAPVDLAAASGEAEEAREPLLDDGHGRHLSGRFTGETNRATPDEDSGALDQADVAYSANSFMAVVKPVTLCMTLSAFITVSLYSDANGATNSALSVYEVYDESAATLDPSSVRLGKSLVNAFIIVLVLAAATVVIVWMYWMRCMKCLLGYMAMSSAALLGVMGGAVWGSALEVFQLPCDAFTYYGVLWNFAVVGVVAIFYQKGIPTVVTQGYLVATSIIMAWQLSRFEEWTGWCLLVVLALYDLCAVLTPCGPLKALVNLMQEYEEPMPGLLYEAELPSGPPRRRPRNARSAANQQRRRQATQGDQEQGNGSDSPTIGGSGGGRGRGGGALISTERIAGVKQDEGGGCVDERGGRTEAGVVSHSSPAESESESESLIWSGEGSSSRGAGGLGDGDHDVAAAGAAAPLLELAGASPLGVATAGGGRVELGGGGYGRRGDGDSSRAAGGGAGGHESPPARGGNTSASQGFGDVSLEEGALAGGPGERERARRRRRSRRAAAEEYEEEEETGVSIKLGLGDFVFYSVLVSKAALYGFTAWAACVVVIVFGLGATLVLLAVYRMALPALPISIGLGTVFYLLTRFSLQPYVEALNETPLYL
eukprot:g7662.t1